MPEYFDEQPLVTKLFVKTLVFACIFLILGVISVSLYFTQTYISMDEVYNIYSEQFGMFLLGAGWGLLKISCIAYAFAHRRPIDTSEENLQ